MLETNNHPRRSLCNRAMPECTPSRADLLRAQAARLAAIAPRSAAVMEMVAARMDELERPRVAMPVGSGCVPATFSGSIPSVSSSVTEAARRIVSVSLNTLRIEAFVGVRAKYYARYSM